MSTQAIQFGKILNSDPALCHFAIQLLEEEDGRWELLGSVPTEGIKRRAGSLARGIAPPSVWLLNHIVVETDDGMGADVGKARAGVA